MKSMKRWACVALCVMLIISALACGKKGDRDETASAVEAPAVTAETAPSQTLDPTLEPTVEPSMQNTDALFLSLDKELFDWYVTQDVTYLDQYVANPDDYGIDASTVPVTLGEFTEEANAKWCADCETFLTRLSEINKNDLSEQNRFAYDVIQQYLEYELLFQNTFYFYEPLEQYVGFQASLPLTFGLYNFRNVQDVENYLMLMADVPRYMQQVIDFEKKRAELGLFMTEAALDVILSDCQNMIDAKDTCYLYTTFTEELDTLPGLSSEQKTAYTARNDELIANSFIASYQTLYDALEALRPFCRASAGMATLGEEAKAYYAACIKTESSSALEPKEAADLLVKYANSCYKSVKTLCFADETLLDRDAAGDVISFGSIEEDVAYLKELTAEYMPELPEVDVEYKEIPAELQDTFSPAAYLVPSIDGWKNNTVLINPADEADLLTLAHEAYPGHLFQFVYQRAASNESLFQRLVSPIGYEEGWTTNTELSISKRAEAFDANYCLLQHYWSFFTYCLSAACSIYVNYMEYTEEELATFLSTWNFDTYASTFYQDSVDMPIYYFCYALGYCLQQEVYANTYSAYAFSDKEFYTAYLALGAGYFNLVEPAMLAWAQNKSA